MVYVPPPPFHFQMSTQSTTLYTHNCKLYMYISQPTSQSTQKKKEDRRNHSSPESYHLIVVPPYLRARIAPIFLSIFSTFALSAG